MNKAPAFQFYYKDWLSGTKVRLMTPAQRGGYMDLLCHAWDDPECSLPDDDESLAALSGLLSEWKAGSKVIRSCFTDHPTKKGFIVNERLIKEREKQEEWREKCSQGGLKSAKARKNKGKRTRKGSSKSSSTTAVSKQSSNAQVNVNSSVFSLQSSSSSSFSFATAVKTIVGYLNEKAKTNYKSTSQKTIDLIKARANEDHSLTIKDFFTVIDTKVTEWKNDSKLCKFLRPETLFSNKFEGYLNQPSPESIKESTKPNTSEKEQIQKHYDSAKKNAPKEIDENVYEKWRTLHALYPNMGWGKLLTDRGLQP